MLSRISSVITIVKRQGGHIQKFPIVQVLAGGFQALGRPDINFLAVIAHSRVQHPQVDEPFRRHAALFFQLTLGCFKRVFVLFQFAGRQFPQFFFQCVTVLAHHQHLVIICQGQNARPSVVVYHLAEAGHAIFQLHLVHGHAEHVPLKNFFGVQFYFGMLHGRS